jgi:hypothetical protein
VRDAWTVFQSTSFIFVKIKSLVFISNNVSTVITHSPEEFA